MYAPPHALTCGLARRQVRISFPGTTDHVREAMRRLAEWWESDKGQQWRGGRAPGNEAKRAKVQA